MHIFLFHRDLRIHDNTALIHQMKSIPRGENVIPIFIFTPEQINPRINDYFSNNSVQFMIESLMDLSAQIREKDGVLRFFYGDTMTVLRQIHSAHKISSIAYNLDYTPYAKSRDAAIETWCKKIGAQLYTKEDYALHDILTGETTKPSDKTPYQIFTPFKNHCSGRKIREPDPFRAFRFSGGGLISDIKSAISTHDFSRFYKPNTHINVHGGRKNALKILAKMGKFDEYNTRRDILTYKTTFLSAHNHFTTVSIREVYYSIVAKLGARTKLINELYWRDFYMNITHYFPHVLRGRAFKSQYNSIPWSKNRAHFEKWCDGKTGFPLIDAAQNQLRETGFMHNRARMCSAMFLTKDLHISWKWGEKFFAQHLVDYSPMQNNGGWQWASSTGTDAQPYFRVFNPWTQSAEYDPKCEYIKTWIPELHDVPPRDILNWWREDVRAKYPDVLEKYREPMIDHDHERKKAISQFQK